MEAHRIHLRGAWTQHSGEHGSVWIRRFGSPLRLDPGVQVWLVIEGSIAPTGIWLNGSCLKPGTDTVPESVASRVNVTAHLHPRNVLSVEMPGQGSLGLVYLEFRSESDSREGSN